MSGVEPEPHVSQNVFMLCDLIPRSWMNQRSLENLRRVLVGPVPHQNRWRWNIGAWKYHPENLVAILRVRSGKRYTRPGLHFLLHSEPIPSETPSSEGPRRATKVATQKLGTSMCRSGSMSFHPCEVCTNIRIIKSVQDLGHYPGKCKL